MIVIDGKKYLSAVETAVKMTRRSSWMIPLDDEESVEEIRGELS